MRRSGASVLATRLDPPRQKAIRKAFREAALYPEARCAVIRCRPIGALLMEDEAGMDEKIVAVPSSHITQRFETVNDYSDLPKITLEQIEHFFAHYKDLEPGKWVKIILWGDAAEAKTLISEGVARAKAAK